MDFWKQDPVFLNDLNVIAYKAEMKDSLMSLDTENGFLGHGQFGCKFKAKLFIKELTTTGSNQVERENPVLGVVEKIDRRLYTIDFQVIGNIHPNILCPPTIFVATEYIFLASPVSTTLKSMFKHPSLTIDQPLSSIVSQIAKGLAYLHSKLIVHRNLKPESIAVTYLERDILVKLTGFGVNRKQQPNSSVKLWKIAGSKSWMAPEVYDASEFSLPMDLFSYGLLLFFCLSGGRHAYGNYKEERVLMMKRKIQMLLSIHDLKIGSEELECIYPLICSLLDSNPLSRPPINKVLEHRYFSGLNLNASANMSFQLRQTVGITSSPKPKLTSQFGNFLVFPSQHSQLDTSSPGFQTTWRDPASSFPSVSDRSFSMEGYVRTKRGEWAPMGTYTVEVKRRLQEWILNLTKIIFTNQCIRIPLASPQWTKVHEESGGILFKNEGEPKYLLEGKNRREEECLLALIDSKIEEDPSVTV